MINNFLFVFLAEDSQNGIDVYLVLNTKNFIDRRCQPRERLKEKRVNKEMYTYNQKETDKYM